MNTLVNAVANHPKTGMAVSGAAAATPKITSWIDSLPEYLANIMTVLGLISIILIIYANSRRERRETERHKMEMEIMRRELEAKKPPE
jgi:hypothetical protein